MLSIERYQKKDILYARKLLSIKEYEGHRTDVSYHFTGNIHIVTSMLSNSSE